MEPLCLSWGLTGGEDEYGGIPNICSPSMQSPLLSPAVKFGGGPDAGVR